MSKKPAKLSEAYKKKINTLAVCDQCGSIFEDDMPQSGSVTCPNCPGHALHRGIADREEADRILEGFKRWRH